MQNQKCRVGPQIEQVQILQGQIRSRSEGELVPRRQVSNKLPLIPHPLIV